MATLLQVEKNTHKLRVRLGSVHLVVPASQRMELLCSCLQNCVFSGLTDMRTEQTSLCLHQQFPHAASSTRVRPAMRNSIFLLPKHERPPWPYSAKESRYPRKGFDLRLPSPSPGRGLLTAAMETNLQGGGLWVNDYYFKL